MALLAVLLVAAPAGSPDASAGTTLTITAVGVKIFPGIVQVAITGSGPLTFQAASSESPFRVAIDLPGAALAPSVRPVTEIQRGPVLRVRAAQVRQSPALARVTIELNAPVAFEVTAATPQVIVARLPMTVGRAPDRPAAQAGTSAQAPPPPAPAASPVPPDRITLDLRNTEIADVLNALAKLCLFNIVTDASVKGTITVRLVEVTCDEALRFILEANNLGFRRVGRNLIVMAAEKLAPPPEVPEPVVYALGFADPERVRAALAAAVPGIRVSIDTRTNSVIVFGTPTQQEMVQKILTSLDVRIAQIMIEARIVDVSAAVLKELGLDFGLTAFPITIEGMIPSFLDLSQLRVFSGPIIALLSALVREGKARVITAPRVAVVEGNKATVNLGEEVPIPQIDSTGRITFTFKPVGVILEITPRLNRDGLITTTVVPEVSSIIEFIGSPPVPRIATRKANTVVTVKNGESIVIAGMISAQERRTVVKVPLLGDIPIIGALFRKTTTDRSESEVIFVVTPQLVPAAGP